MDIKVPAIAEGVTEGTVVSILVNVGDTIKEGDNVVELESSKAVAPIPATAGGTVTSIHVSEGDVVPVGGLLVTLDGEVSDAPKADAAPKQEAAPAAPAQPVAPVAPAAPVGGAPYQAPAGVPVAASPSVRKMARELGIDLTRIRGTESGGRISMGDLRNYIAYIQQAAAGGAQAQVAAAPAAPAKKAPAPSVDFSKWGPVHKEKLTTLRKTIAKAMSNSWETVPRITQFDDINISPIMDLRKSTSKNMTKAGAKLTVTGFVIKAIANTLKKNPILTAALMKRQAKSFLKITSISASRWIPSKV